MQYRMLGRIALTAGLAAFGAVAAFATMAPGHKAAPAATQALVEPLPVSAAQTAAAASSFIREEQFQRGDTLGNLLSRLGVADEEGQRVVRLRSLRELRPGAYVTAEIAADGSLLSLAWLSGRDTLVRI